VQNVEITKKSLHTQLSKRRKSAGCHSLPGGCHELAGSPGCVRLRGYSKLDCGHTWTLFMVRYLKWAGVFHRGSV